MKLTSAEPFACDTKGQKIVLRGKPSFSSGNGMQISQICGNNIIMSSNNNVSGSIFINGVDVTDAVRGAVERKKGITQEDELDDSYKLEHVVEGIIKLSVLTVSGTSELDFTQSTMLDTENLDLDASGTTKLILPPCIVDAMTITASGMSSISGKSCSVKRLNINSSGMSKVSHFYVLTRARLNASGMSNINITPDVNADIVENKSGMAKISLRKFE
jgi:hypothetical protein